MRVIHRPDHSLVRLLTIRGIRVYVSIGVIALFGAGIVGSLFLGLPLLVGYLTYLSTTIVHELGHAYLAARKGYPVVGVDLQVFHGACWYEHYKHKDFPHDEAVIAWGGVLAELCLFLPAAIFLAVVGNTTSGVINVVLVVLVMVTFASMIVSLLPADGYDGKVAWRLLRPTLAALAQRSSEQSKRKRRSRFKIVK